MLDAKRNEIVTEMQKWTEISLNKQKKDIMKETSNEVMKQIKRITSVPGVIGYECPYVSLEGFISSTYYTLKSLAADTNARLQTHDSQIEDADASIEGISRKLRHLTEKTEMDSQERKTQEMTQIQKFE